MNLLSIQILMMMFLINLNHVNALSDGEIIALKDMQLEWGTQLGWTGSPSCDWRGIACNGYGNVIQLYVDYNLFFQIRIQYPGKFILFNLNCFILDASLIQI